MENLVQISIRRDGSADLAFAQNSTTLERCGALYLISELVNQALQEVIDGTRYEFSNGREGSVNEQTR